MIVRVIDTIDESKIAKSPSLCLITPYLIVQQARFSEPN
jgi:hypothetical protein